MRHLRNEQKKLCATLDQREEQLKHQDQKQEPSEESQSKEGPEKVVS
jgi:hypothetical protein